jgi:hypothetical protein
MVAKLCSFLNGIWEWVGTEQQRNPRTAPDRYGSAFKTARSSRTADSNDSDRHCPPFSRVALFNIREMFAIQTNCRVLIYVKPHTELPSCRVAELPNC